MANTDKPAGKKPSDYCCLNPPGCSNPDVCNNEIGHPCGWPGTREEWERTNANEQSPQTKAEG